MNKENNGILIRIIIQTILTIIFVLVLIRTLYLIVVYFILWLILRKIANEDNVLWKAYNLAFNIIGIPVLVMLIAVGTCMVLFM